MTTSFHEQSFSERYATLGDPAESVFETVAPLGTWDRFGWNRPKNSMRKMAPLLRNQPDYYAGGHLVEVMGLGRDGLLKLKLKKMAVLLAWQEIQPVMMFVWNSHKAAWALVEIEEVERLFHQAQANGTKKFHDGPEYVEIAWADLVHAAKHKDKYDPASN